MNYLIRNPDEDLVYFFHNLVGYKNPEEKIINKNQIESNCIQDYSKIKLNNSNDNKNMNDKESFPKNENDNLNFIDLNFIYSNRDNLDNVINNIIRLNKSILILNKIIKLYKESYLNLI